MLTLPPNKVSFKSQAAKAEIKKKNTQSTQMAPPQLSFLYTNFLYYEECIHIYTHCTATPTQHSTVHAQEHFSQHSPSNSNICFHYLYNHEQQLFIS